MVFLKIKNISVLLIVFLIVFSVSGCRKNSDNNFLSSENSLLSVVETESSDVSSLISVPSEPETENSQAEEISDISSAEKPQDSVSTVVSSKPTVETVCIHSYQSTKIEKTCTQDGYTQHVCSKCGDIYKDNIVSASHNFVNYYCTICNVADKSNAGIIVYNYVQANGVSEEYYSSNVFSFGNGLYKVSALNSGWLFFEYNDSNNDEIIKLSVYSGILKDDCYLEYFKADSKVEFEFHKENLHSKEPDSVWNQMNHYGSISKNQMISDIRFKIDGFMLQFQNNLLNNLGLTLKDFGFSNFN